MHGLLGFLFPRKSSNMVKYEKLLKEDKSKAREFLQSLGEVELDKFISERMGMKLDEHEQQRMAKLRKEIEDCSYPVGFSED